MPAPLALSNDPEFVAARTWDELLAVARLRIYAHPVHSAERQRLLAAYELAVRDRRDPRRRASKMRLHGDL